MKASAFAYARATSIDNALELLAANGDRVKVLSGGQSLMPAMNLRLISPELIVDISGLVELRGIVVHGTMIRIGALTRHVDILKSHEIATHAPLLGDAVAHVAHPAIRNRGTIGGAIANADPSADWPAAVLALDAMIEVIGPRGKRTIAARDFFKGLFETALGTDEVLVAVRIPVVAGARAAYRKFRHPSSGYAVAGIAVVATVEGSECKDVRIAATGLADHQFRVSDAEAALKGKTVKAGQIDRAVADAFAGVTPLEDRFANARYRLQLGRTMLRRALSDVFAS